MELTQIALSTIEYTNSSSGTVLHLFGRDKDLIRWHIPVYNFHPFFYVPENEPVQADERITRVLNLQDEHWTSITNIPVKRIEVNSFEQILGTKDESGTALQFKQTFEEDIQLNHAVVELGIKSGFAVQTESVNLGLDPIVPVDFKAELRRIHLDIEVSMAESAGIMPTIYNPVNPIYCMSCLDSYSKLVDTFVWYPTYKNRIDFTQQYIMPLTEPRHIVKFEKEYTVTIHTFSNEKDMLNVFIDYIEDKDPDILTGWNSRKFDVPYIVARCIHLGLNVKKLSPLGNVYLNKHSGIVKIRGRIVFDTWEGYKKLQINKERGTSLGFVSQKLFGVSKIAHKQGFDEMIHQNRNLLIKYNIQDAFLDYAIGEDQKIFQFFYDVKCYTGCMYEDVLHNSMIIDMYCLFKAKEYHIVLPSKKRKTEEEKTESKSTEVGFEGAVVFAPPKKGVQKWVCTLDLKSLYPMCIITLNMGEDTIVLNPELTQIPNLIKSPIDHVYFKKEKPSFLVSILTELVDYRDKMKNEAEKAKQIKDFANFELYTRIQTVVKFITNSLYGVIGNTDFRLFNINIASNITAVGRLVIMHSARVVKRLGYLIQYGDTDSIFPILHGTTIDACKTEMFALVEKLNQSYAIFLKLFNIDKHYFKMKGEKIFETILMVPLKGKKKELVAKKRYAAHQVWDDKKGTISEPALTGFERSDSSIVGSAVMKKVLEMICFGQTEQMIQYIQAEIQKIITMKYSLAEIALSKGISKAFTSYAHPGNWIRAAMWTNKHSHLWNAQTNFNTGDKIKSIFVEPMKLPSQFEKTEIVALDDNDSLPESLYSAIDWKMVLEKTIRNKIETILSAVNVKWEDLMQDQQTTTNITQY